MKKVIVFLLSLALMVSFCGCAVHGDRDNPETEPSNLSNDATDSDTSSSSEEFSMGKIADTVYTSDFIGIRFKLQNGWTFYDEDQIKELNQLAVDMAGDEYEELLKNATIIYDMYATDSNQLNNVNINLEKINLLQLAVMDIKANFNASIPILKESFGNMGYVNINCEIIKVEVDGETVDALRTTAEISGVNMYQVMFQKKCNGYLAAITTTTYVDDTTSDLLDNFEWIE